MGLIGTVRAAHDGSCTAGGYYRTGKDGKATSSEKDYRVIKRNAET